ncbi:hypothetical protein FGG08_007410 [Glutinoglossum americanum]|uniref:HNH nuclease domain-containing protein n=1 Tax=Glutinoglossum americanum TaxID=1670608 RepID=A0A9P8KWG1_9PEZI|nr:hypothetical protein FGG08_007410 [Glutinoglossum americanum]
MRIEDLNILHERLDHQSVNPSFHAFCHFTTSPDASSRLLAMDKEHLLKLNAKCHRALSMWLIRQTKDDPPGADLSDGADGRYTLYSERYSFMPSATSATPRSKKNVAEVGLKIVPKHTKLTPNQTLLRDSKSSVISHFGLPVEVAHIFSYSLARDKDDLYNRKWDFYQVLELFFGAECVAGLQTQIFGGPDDPRTDIDRLENLITLTQHEHCFFGGGLIVLEPIPGSQAPDNSRYDVIFKKVGRSTHTANQADLPINHLPTPLDENIAQDLREVFLPNFETRAEIRTGDIIRLTTQNPKTRPLPDPTLLSLHAAISQIVRMAGRAGIPEWEYDDCEEVEGEEDQDAPPPAESINQTTTYPDPQPEGTTASPPAVLSPFGKTGPTTDDADTKRWTIANSAQYIASPFKRAWKAIRRPPRPAMPSQSRHLVKE